MLKVFFISLINLIKFINLDIKKKEYVFFSESKFYKDHFIDLIDIEILINQILY